MRKKFFFLLFVLIVTILAASPTMAAFLYEPYKITTSIPGTDIVAGNSIDSITIQQYIVSIYTGALALVGLTAFIMIVYWGFVYTLSGGNASKKADAMGGLRDAVVGIILLLGGYLILNFVNPDLVKLQPLGSDESGQSYLPVLDSINKPPTGGSGGGLSCNANKQCVAGGGGATCTADAQCVAGGAKADGSSCQDYSECLSLNCDPTSKKCAPKKNNGIACQFPYECKSLYCDTASKTCLPQFIVDAGQSCDGYITQCKGTLQCISNKCQ